MESPSAPSRQITCIPGTSKSCRKSPSSSEVQEYCGRPAAFVSLRSKEDAASGGGSLLLQNKFKYSFNGPDANPAIKATNAMRIFHFCSAMVMNACGGCEEYCRRRLDFFGYGKKGTFWVPIFKRVHSWGDVHCLRHSLDGTAFICTSS